MSANSFKELRKHIGHKIECVCYGVETDTKPVNVSLECETCKEVLLDFDN